MNQADRCELEDIIDEWAEIFSVSANRVDAAKRKYFTYLADISMVKMRKVAVMAVQSLDTFPSIHRLRELAGVTNLDRCRACAGSDRISHVKAVTIDYFAECMESIDHTIEAVYGHCRAKYEEEPEIRLWAKQAIAEHLGWSTLPWRFQTEAQRAQVRAGLETMEGA